MAFELPSSWGAAMLLTAALLAGGLLSTWLRRHGDLAHWALWFSAAAWTLLLVAVAWHDDAARAAAVGLVAGAVGAVLADEAASRLRPTAR